GLWLRPRGLGVPTRHAVLAAARRHRRVHAARARDRRRAELLPAGHRWGFRLVGVCAGDVLFFLVSPLVRPARRFRRRRGSSICSRTHLFRVPRTDRNRGRPSAGPGLLPAGARLSGELPAATLRGRAAVRAGLLSSSSPRPGGFHNRDLVFMARLAAAVSRAARRRFSALLAAAVVIVAVHSCIAHKEYRFIYPAVLLLTVLASAGLASLVQWVTAWLIQRGLRETTAAAASILIVLGYWSIVSFNLWNGPALADLRHRASDNLAGMSLAASLSS